MPRSGLSDCGIILTYELSSTIVDCRVKPDGIDVKIKYEILSSKVSVDHKVKIVCGKNRPA